MARGANFNGVETTPDFVMARGANINGVEATPAFSARCASVGMHAEQR
jgi:hypothetical protein